MSETKTCANPKCTCESCTCGDCKCGAGLGALEGRVMEIFWEEPGCELTGRHVADVLPDYAYTTIATVLDRLAHKGFVRRRKEGRAIKFAATSSRAAHTVVAMHEALGTTRDSEDALVRFAKSLSPSEAEIVRRTLAVDR